MKLSRERLLPWAGVATVTGLSVTAWLVVRHAHLVLSYKDAMSHLNIGRRVIDNLQPGLAQIGTIWLPLSHLLYLPFVWNYWAWQSGFAGSLISMVSYITATIGIYMTVKSLAGSRPAAVVGAAAFALNLNLLYLQSTPLTESLYLTLLVWSVFCLVRYIQTDDARFLIGVGVLGLLQVLCRYDGWFVVIVESGIVLAHQLLLRRAWRAAIGRTVLVITPAAFGIGLWLLWNANFGNPFYFAVGSGSAGAQQSVIAASSGLVAKHNLPLSAWIYLHVAADNIGLTVMALAAVGLGYWLLRKDNRFSVSARWLIAGLLAAPFAFNILALYLGFSTISIPEQLSSTNIRDQWFNVRYGIIVLPAAAVAVGLLARWGRTVAVALVLVVALQAAQMWHDVPITIADGTKGQSAFVDADVSQQLKEHVQPGQHVLMSFSAYNPVAFASGLDLSQFVHEGVQNDWTPDLTHPGPSVDWIVMSSTQSYLNDPVYASLAQAHPDVLRNYYHLVYRGQDASIYERDRPALTKL